MDIEALHPSGLVQHNSEQTEDMLTLRPNINIRAGSHPPGDIDIDENLLAPEPEADELRQTVPGETMAMRPGVPATKFHQHVSPSTLKQEKFQSWDRYLAAGEALKSMLPKRKEGAAVEAFVDGIYDEKLRQNFESVLDEVGWSWDSVKGFVKQHAAVEVETQARQRTESLTHKHKKGGVCPVCSKTAKASKDGEMATAIADIPPQLPLHQAVQRPQTADPRRRSQRILQQSQASPGEATKTVEPKPQKMIAPKPVEKSQVVIQGTLEQMTAAESAQDHVKSPKQKSIATKAGAGISTEGVRSLATLQGGMQRKNLKLVKQDFGIRKDMETTPELPRNKKSIALQKTKTPAPANFQANTPINNTVHQDSPDLKNKHVNTTAISREVPKMRSGKKRKLVEQLEAPTAAKRDLAIPLNKRIGHGEAREPQRKKRSKKRAVAPIPMIPILPLSDDE